MGESRAMRFAIVFIVGIVILYLAVWTLVYASFMQLDFSHFGEYFRLAWSGGGELPALIQLYTIVVVGVAGGVALTVIVILKRRRPGSR